MPHSEGKGVLFVYVAVVVPAKFSSGFEREGFGTAASDFSKMPCPLRNKNMEIKYKPIIASAFTLSDLSLNNKVESQD